MNTIHYRRLRNILALLSLLVLAFAGGCATQTIPKAGIYELDDNTLLVKGVVAKVTEEYLLVKYSLRDTIRMETSEEMILNGFPSLWAIETEQPVKINYRVEGEKNIIISVTKMPRLGC